MKLLAIETIHVYTTLCKYFVVVTPDAIHEDTQLHVDLRTYMERGACAANRISQWIVAANAESPLAAVAESVVQVGAASSRPLASWPGAASTTCSCVRHARTTL
jgi:hypothetical protein